MAGIHELATKQIALADMQGKFSEARARENFRRGVDLYFIANLIVVGISSLLTTRLNSGSIPMADVAAGVLTVTGLGLSQIGRRNNKRILNNSLRNT